MEKKKKEKKKKKIPMGNCKDHKLSCNSCFFLGESHGSLIELIMNRWGLCLFPQMIEHSEGGKGTFCNA